MKISHIRNSAEQERDGEQTAANRTALVDALQALLDSGANKDQLLSSLRGLDVVKDGEKGNAAEFDVLDEAAIRTRIQGAIAEWGADLPVKDMTVKFSDAVSGISNQVESTPDDVELSSEHQATLELLLEGRYQAGLDAGLYTEGSAPKAQVEAWFKADTARLDAAAKWEARGGKPMFVGEFEGEWVLAECSAEVPKEPRNICYGPNAAKLQGLSEDRNALAQAKILGGELMPKALGERLEGANLIKNANTWEWRAHPDNKDLDLASMQTDQKDYGLAWYAGCGCVVQGYARGRIDIGGLRCSLSGPKS